MVIKKIKSLFKKFSSKKDSEDISIDEVNQLLKNKNVDDKLYPVHHDKTIKEDKEDGFVRYICGNCYKWSDFKSGSVPKNCPHCGNSSQDSFKPQRKYEF